MIKVKHWVGAALLLSLATSATRLQAAETLRWRLKKGQLLRLSMVQESEVATTIRLSKLKMSVKMSFDLDWFVKEIDDQGIATIEQSFKRLELKMSSPNLAAVEYDSSSKVEPRGASAEMAASMAPLLDLKFMVKMDNRGQIKSVGLPSESEAKLGELPPQLKSIFSEEGLRRTLQQSTLALPMNAMDKGDSWAGKSKSTTRLGEMTTTSDYTYEGVVEREGRSVAKINVKSQIALAVKKQVKPASTFGLKNQSYYGTIYFDADKGLLAYSVSEQTLATQTQKKNLLLETNTTTKMRLEMRELK